MIERLLPPDVVTIETRGELLGTPLYPDEERALGRAVPKRRREFTTGRACARMALRRLGMQPTSIGTGAHGEPLWPTGVRGSITHCRGYCACAATTAPDVLSVGIDAEPHAPLPPGVLDSVAGERERHWARIDRAGLCLDRLLFSAKEAIYKAWFPLVGAWLGFEDVELTVDIGDASFRGSVLVPVRVMEGHRPPELRGRWYVEGGILATAVVVRP